MSNEPNQQPDPTQPFPPGYVIPEGVLAAVSATQSTPEARAATVNLEPLRQLVSAHLLVEELETMLERAKKHEEALQKVSEEQLALAGIKTMPVSADEAALRVVALGAGRILVQLDVPGAEREDFDAAALNDRLQELILAVIDEDCAPATPEGCPPTTVPPSQTPGRNHRRPMNVTVAGQLWLGRSEGIEREQACAALQAAGFEDLVRLDYSSQAASAAARELLDQLEECAADERARAHDAAAVHAARTDAETLKSKIAALRVAFEFVTKTAVRVTRAGNKESRSSRNTRTLRKL